MKLSIIIRTFNRLEYTIRSIVSIDEKSGLNRSEYEIICVDQGSTDGTIEWLNSCVEEGYYSVFPIFLKDNIGDGLGMQEGIEIATGEFIAQHDNDIELVSENYYSRLIKLYKYFENFGWKICAMGGQHKQGVNRESTPWRFGKERYFKEVFGCKYFYDIPVSIDDRMHVSYPISWVTASFIFRRGFTSVPFGKGMCNSWCGDWWDRGFDNFSCETLKFWHIDSGETGAHIQKQYGKFPSYKYVFKNYRKFIK